MITSIAAADVPAATGVGLRPASCSTCTAAAEAANAPPDAPPERLLSDCCSAVAEAIASTAAVRFALNSLTLLPRTVNRSVEFSLPVYENIDSVI